MFGVAGRVVLILVLVLSGFVNILQAEENVTVKTGPTAMLYFQTGFWDGQVCSENGDPCVDISSDLMKQKLTDHKSAMQYYESFQSRDITGNIAYCGGLAVFIGTILVANNTASDVNQMTQSEKENLINGMGTGMLVGTGLMLAGLFIKIYAQDDVYKAVHEYNKDVMAAGAKSQSMLLNIGREFRF